MKKYLPLIIFLCLFVTTPVFAKDDDEFTITLPKEVTFAADKTEVTVNVSADLNFGEDKVLRVYGFGWFDMKQKGKSSISGEVACTDPTYYREPGYDGFKLYNTHCHPWDYNGSNLSKVLTFKAQKNFSAGHWEDTIMFNMEVIDYSTKKEAYKEAKDDHCNFWAVEELSCYGMPEKEEYTYYNGEEEEIDWDAYEYALNEYKSQTHLRANVLLTQRFVDEEKYASFSDLDWYGDEYGGDIEYYFNGGMVPPKVWGEDSGYETLTLKTCGYEDIIVEFSYDFDEDKGVSESMTVTSGDGTLWGSGTWDEINGFTFS